MSYNKEELCGLIDSVVSVSNEFRRFDTDANMAQSLYGVSVSLLDELVELGLPSEVHENKRYFHGFDLSNIGLHAGLPSVQRMAIRTWARTHQLLVEPILMNANIKILPLSGDLVSSNPLMTLNIPLIDTPKFASGRIQDLLFEFSKFKFFMLPEGCRWDIEFILKNRICECGGASKLMLFLAKDFDVEVRQCFGLLLAKPFSTGHYWAEFKLDGEWVAFDPLLLNLLHLTTRLDKIVWPINRSNGGALHRLCVIQGYDSAGVPDLGKFLDLPNVANPLMVLDGQAIAVSLPTQIQPLSAVQFAP